MNSGYPDLVAGEKDPTVWPIFRDSTPPPRSPEFGSIDFFCVSKLSIDLFFKLPVSRFLAINIEGKIGQLTVRRTLSFIKRTYNT
jgi:hypothetical protein